MMPPPMNVQSIRSQIGTNPINQMNTMGPQVSHVSPIGKPTSIIQQQTPMQQPPPQTNRTLPGMEHWR